MKKMHLVFGGPVKDPCGQEFVNLQDADLVGLFDDYEHALDAWRANAQRTVDDAEMKYVIVPLHKLLDPDAEELSSPPESIARG